MNEVSKIKTGTAANRPHIALVGPVLPFRGGIAQYTTQLHRALAPKCQLLTISYRRQYPSWLYPGKSDREPGQLGYREPGVDYFLDSLNPLSWLHAASCIVASGCSYALFDWWTLFWAPATALMARRLHREGVRIMFLCHNLYDHDAGLFKRTLASLLLSQADAYLVHTRAQADWLKEAFPVKPVLTHPHPTYDNYPAPARIPPKRGRLELLFFGFIRPYKGLDCLIDALSLLADRDVYLTVAGEPWCRPEDLQRRISECGAPNIELHLQYMEAATAAEFFARADVVVLPYRKATGSGVAAMAYHYDKPVLATRVGGFSDIVGDGRTGFLVDPDSPDQLATVIRTLTREKLAPMITAVRDYKSQFTWSSLADAVIELALTMTPNQAATSAPSTAGRKHK